MAVGTAAGSVRRSRTLHRAAARSYVTGAASVAIRAAIESPRRPARVLASFPMGMYLEVRGDAEPYVVAVLAGAATRLPNAVMLHDALPTGDDAWVGDGVVEVGRVTIRVSRWWDPAPPLGPVDPVRLTQAAPALAAACEGSARRPGLDTSGAPEALAEACANGSLLDAIGASEQLMGLGPGLTPSGDDMLSGLLVALRHLGGATGSGRAIRLADWLAATVRFDARTRTTPISATLLDCASRGEASTEVLGVLRGIAGRQPLEPAAHRLLRLGHTSGADLAWGIRAGLAAVTRLKGRS